MGRLPRREWSWRRRSVNDRGERTEDGGQRSEERADNDE